MHMHALSYCNYAIIDHCSTTHSKMINIIYMFNACVIGCTTAYTVCCIEVLIMREFRKTPKKPSNSKITQTCNFNCVAKYWVLT